MSTRGLIAIQDADGSCRSIYCHHDMYPSYALGVLKEHYETREKVEALLARGSLSSLNETPETCAAYIDTGYRVDEIEWYTPRHWPNRNALFASEEDGYGYLGTEYVYLFTRTGRWTWRRYLKALE